jgi:hypothetical protein
VDKRNYLLFCASIRVEGPPPYKGFLHELEREMPHKRHDMQLMGEPRQTFTTYRVPDPNATVVTPLRRDGQTRVITIRHRQKGRPLAANSKA